MHFVHRFDVVADFFVQASLLILVVSTEHADVLVLPVPPFIHGFESLFQDADFNVCFEIVPVCPDVFCEIVVVRTGLRVISMTTEPIPQFLLRLSHVN